MLNFLKCILICVVLLPAPLSQAQSIKDIIAKGFNSDEIQTTIKEFNGKQVESFIPFRKSYLLSYPQSGVELEFNPDMSLYQISLYDSGNIFSSYSAHLPYGAKWGMDSVEIQNQNGVMIPQSQNPFIKYYEDDKCFTHFYFRDGKLELIRIIAKDEYIIEQGAESVSLWGLRLLPDGKAVQGNVLDGEGTMVWGENAASYQGEWSYGLPHGIGIFIDSFGNKYVGEFKLGFFWGAGSYVSNYYKYNYDGYFIMGKRHGQGEIKYSNGTAYKGDWVRDQMEGMGQYTLGKTHYYQGEMKNNNFNGKGILTTPDGYIKGRFKDGKPNGYCEQYGNQSGQTLSGYWKAGKKEGEFNLNAFGYDRKIYFENDIEIIQPSNN